MPYRDHGNTRGKGKVLSPGIKGGIGSYSCVMLTVPENTVCKGIVLILSNLHRVYVNKPDRIDLYSTGKFMLIKYVYRSF